MNAAPVIVVADDEAAQRHLLSETLEHAGFTVISCADGAEALVHGGACDLMLLDVRMPNLSGLEVLSKMRTNYPATPVVLLTAYIDVRDAVAAMKMGAKDYIEKPVDLDELIAVIEDILAINVANKGRESLPAGIVAESEAMRVVFRQAFKVAEATATVLIQGESGVGKEIVARYIHDIGPRSGLALVTVDCGALPENLVEAELFGHERGAYTGADTARVGRFAQADRGTLFLDEIGELPLSLQPKLLRFIETGAFRSVGAARERDVDVRVIAATNRDLEQEVAAKRFREDLYYRLNVFPIVVPPLRERREDIPGLAHLFLKQQHKQLAPATERLLTGYDWPGNVRELRNALERAAIVAEGTRILPEALPPAIRKATPQQKKGTVLIGDMAAIERRAIKEALEKTGGNKTQAAKLLGISRRSLIYKLQAYSETKEEGS